MAGEHAEKIRKQWEWKKGILEGELNGLANLLDDQMLKFNIIKNVRPQLKDSLCDIKTCMVFYFFFKFCKPV